MARLCTVAQQGEPEIAMIDAAMVEMANISPPLRRSECQRLIRAALSAAPAPQARTIAQRNVAVVSMFDTQQTAQDVPETNFGNMQPKFLANGTRFKLSFDTRGKVSSLWNFMDELDGRWVALVASEDDCHLQSAQPVAQPLSDSEIEKLREKTFSTYNPYCPVDSKSMRKAVRAAEAAHGIGEVK